MSTRFDVLQAVKALMAKACPRAEVLGIDGSGAAPSRVPPDGLIVVRAGDPGPPVEVTMSPLTYWWDHAIPAEIIAGQPGEAALDAMLVAIGDAIVDDRTLGGRCTWLEASSAGTEDVDADGAGSSPRGTAITITASYSTPSPLA